MEILSKSPAETRKFAEDFLKTISNKNSGRATVIGLYGNLGSGKTTFVQFVAEILGVKDTITSPTFVIMKSYRLSSANFQTLKLSNFKTLVHIDAYRLKSGEELRKLGSEDLLKDPGNLILIEWADLVADILPEDCVRLNFEFVDDTTRRIWVES